MDKRLITGLTAVVMLVLIIFVGCVDNGGERDDEFGKLALDAKILYMTVGELHSFALNTADKGGKFKWSVKHGALAEVDDNGNLKAKAVGRTRVSVQSDNGKSAACDVIIADAIVSAAFKDEETLPEKRYAKVQDAADKGGSIVVMAGKYEEFVKADKPVSLLGVDSVSLRGISGWSVAAENIAFVTETPPKADAALVTAGEDLSLKNCSFSVAENAEQPAGNSGGYAVFVAEKVKRVNITGCSFANFRYAVYVDKAPAEISITENSLSKNKIGIGVNLAVGMTNSEASGVIKDNIYTECAKDTDFTFNGGDYKGALDFEDYFSEPPKKKPESGQN